MNKEDHEILKKEYDKCVKQYGKIKCGSLKNANLVEQVQQPKEGGILTFFKEVKFPRKGFALLGAGDDINKTKGVTVWALKLMHRKIKKHLKDPKLYCPFVRELYRVMNIVIERERYPTMIEKMTMVRDIVCTWFEEDMAYRFRGQDATAEVDIEKMKPDKNDWFWMNKRIKTGNYNYGGKDPDWDRHKRSENQKKK